METYLEVNNGWRTAKSKIIGVGVYGLVVNIRVLDEREYRKKDFISTEERDRWLNYHFPVAQIPEEGRF